MRIHGLSNHGCLTWIWRTAVAGMSVICLMHDAAFASGEAILHFTNTGSYVFEPLSIGCVVEVGVATYSACPDDDRAFFESAAYIDCCDTNWIHSGSWCLPMHCDHRAFVRAGASCTTQAPGLYAVWLRGGVEFGWCFCPAPPDICFADGSGSAYQGAVYRFRATSAGRSDWAAEFNTIFADIGEAIPPNRIARSAALLGSLDSSVQATALLRAGTFRYALGVSYDPTLAQWDGTIPITGGNGEYELHIRQMDFDDESMDVDSNGRFNVLDVDTLSSRVGSTEASDLRFWDFNGNGTIDADDIQILDELVRLGLDSGIVGDIDNDGHMDCPAADIASYAFHLGDPGYRIELDADLDGDADTNDFMMIQAHWPDCNGNGVLDACDIIAGVLTDLNDDGIADECQMIGDWDGNGSVDLIDHQALTWCLFGPDRDAAPAPPHSAGDCFVFFDADRDRDVDLEDFATLMRAVGE
jgi:hypothetical protein